jgi:hypothetical protein
MRYLLAFALICVVGCQKDIHEARAPQHVGTAQLSS